MFCKYLQLSSKTIFNINLRKLPSQYGEVSVMNVSATICHSVLIFLLNASHLTGLDNLFLRLRMLGHLQEINILVSGV